MQFVRCLLRGRMGVFSRGQCDVISTSYLCAVMFSPKGNSACSVGLYLGICIGMCIHAYRSWEGGKDALVEERKYLPPVHELFLPDVFTLARFFFYFTAARLFPYLAPCSACSICVLVF